MSGESKKDFLSGTFEPVPLDKLPVFDGLILPGFPEFMTDAEKKITEIKEIDSRSSDILICTYPKSGTHWVSEIVEEVVSGKAEYSAKPKGGLFLDAQKVEDLAGMPSPRNLNTHLPFRMLPRKHFELKASTIHVIRNPKDVAVSYFHHNKKDPFLGAITMPWAEYFQMYMENVPYGTWFEYEKDWEKVKRDNPDLKILTVYYEDLKFDTAKEIKKIAEFLGYNYSDQFIKQVAENVDFKNQSKNKFDFTTGISADKKPFIYRKGEVGDWKNWFTVAQNETFDAVYKTEMKESNLKITFSQ